jgi:hypothetical protein
MAPQGFDPNLPCSQQTVKCKHCVDHYEHGEFQGSSCPDLLVAADASDEPMGSIDLKIHHLTPEMAKKVKDFLSHA